MLIWIPKLQIYKYNDLYSICFQIFISEMKNDNRNEKLNKVIKDFCGRRKSIFLIKTFWGLNAPGSSWVFHVTLITNALVYALTTRSALTAVLIKEGKLLRLIVSSSFKIKVFTTSLQVGPHPYEQDIRELTPHSGAVNCPGFLRGSAKAEATLIAATRSKIPKQHFILMVGYKCKCLLPCDTGFLYSHRIYE